MTGHYLQKLAGLGLGLAMALSATQAGAVVYTVNSANIDSSAGSENGTVHADATSTNGALTEDAAIGRILLTGTTSTGQNFSVDSFCVDIYDWLNAPATFTGDTLSSLGLSTTKNTQLTNLLANVDSYISSGISGTNTGSTADRSAAAQIAIWEIVSETTNVYDADGTTANKGSFYVKNASGVDNLSATALSDAAQLLSAVTTGSWANGSGTQVALVRSSGNQTQVVYGAAAAAVLAGVPEPATWGMMVLGFGALGASLRRKRSGEMLNAIG